MTEEQYKVLEKYEQTLNAAVKCNFLRMGYAEFNEVAAVYDQLYTPLRPGQRNCNTCRLNALKTLGKAYFQEKQDREVKEAEKKAENKPVESPKAPKTTKTTSKPDKKAGRPKKIDLSK